MQLFAEFVLSLLLLCLPSAWWTRGRFRHLPLPQILDHTRLRLALFHPLTLLDLPRAYAGMFLLNRVIAGALEDVSSGRYVGILFLIGVTTLGMALQLCFHRLNPQELHAPFAYFAGVLLAAMPPQVAVPTLLLGITTAVASRSPTVTLLLTGVCLGALGIILGVDKASLLALAMIFVVLLANVTAFNRYFMLPVGKSTYDDVVRPDPEFHSRLR